MRHLRACAPCTTDSSPFWTSKTIAFRPRSKFRIKIIFGAVRSCGCPENQDNFFSLTERHQTERMNRTLLAILRKTANDFPKSWPQHLPSVMSSVHSTTGVTPHMAMFGREVMLPVSMLAKPPEEITAATVPFVSDLLNTLRTLTSGSVKQPEEPRKRRSLGMTANQSGADCMAILAPAIR